CRISRNAVSTDNGTIAPARPQNSWANSITALAISSPLITFARPRCPDIDSTAVSIIPAQPLPRSAVRSVLPRLFAVTPAATTAPPLHAHAAGRARLLDRPH